MSKTTHDRHQLVAGGKTLTKDANFEKVRKTRAKGENFEKVANR